MANNDVNIKLNVKDGGDTAKLNKEAEKLKKAYDEAANAAGRVSKALAPAPKSMALKSADNAAGKGETKTARSVGAGAGTGSAASDFAAQASGLGGLVHVYATFAANIFAVSAAFTALSKAMDTTNLVSGLDQIGAASGRNLGTLAKQMVKAADGAISLRDALTSTALASSAGMSNANIIRMTEVAKKASLALGRDMADSMERLTKGIAKTQPELLDELGIMTRMIPAQQEYARQLGKSAASLTDFEKRQAFANAVLAEGEKKFGDIQLNSNPYSKILASTQNLLQSGLELVNKVLTPLVSFLSSSPVGLTLALGTMATMLMKQAMPAIGAFRENAQKSADIAYASLVRRQADQKRFLEEESSMTSAAAIEQFKQQKAIQSELAKIHFKPRTSGTNAIVPLLQKDPFALTRPEIDKLQVTANEMIDSKHKTWNEEAIRLQNHIDKINGIRQRGDDFAETLVTKGIERDSKSYAHESMLQRIVDKETQQYSNRKILASVAETAAMQGSTRAWRQLNEEIAKSKAGKQTIELFNKEGEVIGTKLVPATNALSNGWTRLKGSIGIATSAVSTALNAFSLWGQVAGLVLAAISALDSLMTKTKVELEAATKAINDLTDSLANAGRVIDVLNKKNPLERFNTQSLGAVATAVQSLSADIAKSMSTTKDYMDKIGWWDSIAEGWKIAFGAGMQDKAAKGLTQAVSKILKIATPGKALDSFKEQIALALKIDPNDSKALEKAITFDNLFKVAPKVQQAINGFTEASTKTSEAAKVLDDAFSVAGKTFDNIITSLAPTDNLAKLGFETLKIATELTTSLSEPTAALSELENIGRNISKLKLLPPDLASSLIAASPAITKTVEGIRKYEIELKSLQEEQSKLLAEQATLKSSKRMRNSEYAKTVDNRVEGNATAISNAKIMIDSGNAMIAPFMQKLKDGTPSIFKHGGELVANSIGIEFAKAAITIQKAYAAGVSGTSGGILLSANVDKASIALQMQVLDVNMSMAKSLENIRIGQEESNIREARKEAKDDPEKLSKLTAREISNNLSKAILNGSSNNALKAVNELLSSKSEVGRNAGAASLDYASKIQGGQASKANLAAQGKAIDITAQFALMDHQAQLDKDTLSLKTSTLSVEKSRLDLAAKYSAYTSEDTLNASRANEEAMISVTLSQEEVDYKEKLAKGYETLKGVANDTKKAEEARAAIREIMSTQAIKDQKNEDAAAIRRQNYVDKELQAYASKLAYEERLNKLRSEVSNVGAQAQLAVREEELSLATALGIYEEKDLAIKKASLDIDKEKQRSSEALVSLAQDRVTIENSFKVKAQGLEQNGGTAEQIAALEVERKLALDVNTAKASSEGIVTAAKQKTLEVTGQMNVLQATQNSQMEKMVSITESLTTLFGEMGTNIGKVGEVLLKMAQDDEAYILKKQTLQNELAGTEANAAKAKAEQEIAANDSVALAKQKSLVETAAIEAAIKDIEKGTSAEEVAQKAADAKIAAGKKFTDESIKNSKAIQVADKNAGRSKLDIMADIAKLDLKKNKGDLSNIGALAGASKKLFAEKTAAYKALDAVEKVSAAMRMGLMAQQMAMELAALPGKIAGGVAALFSQGGWAGFAGAAAFLAILGSFGAFGGGGSATPPALSTNDASGTGQKRMADGSIGDSGNGVIGDYKAQSESLTKSLDYLGKVFFDQLGDSNSSSLLKYLKGIQDNTAETAMALGASGLFSPQNANFGFKEYSGTMGVSEDVIANIDMVIAAATGPLTMLITKLFGGTGFGKEVYRSIAEAIGGKQDIAVLDNGLRASGTLGSLAAGTSSVGGYVTTQKSGTRGMDGGWANYTDPAETNTVNLGETGTKIQATIQKSMLNFKSIIELTAKFMGKTDAEIAALANSPVSIIASMKEADTPEKFAEAWNAAISTEFNRITRENFPFVMKYVEIGGEAGSTMVRLIKDSQDVTVGLGMLGTTIGDFSKTLGMPQKYTGLPNYIDKPDIEGRIAAEQALIKLYGDSETFAGAIQKTYDVLVPEKTKLANRAAAVETAFTQLGVSGIKTKDQLLTLIQAQDLSTDGGRKLFKSLTDLVPAFGEVVDAADAATKKTQDLAATLADTKSGDSLASTMLSRSRALSDPNLSADDKDLQQKIFNAQDANKQAGLDTALLQAQGNAQQILTDKRAKDLANLTAYDLAFGTHLATTQIAINAQEDQNKLDAINLRYDTLTNSAAKNLAASRAKEIKALTGSTESIVAQTTALNKLHKAEDVKAFADKAGVGVSALTNLFMTQLANTDAEGTGKYVGDMIVYGIKKTMYEQALTTVMQTMYDTIITPVVTGFLLTDGSAQSLSTSIAKASTDLVDMADKLDTLFSNEDFQKLLTKVGETAATVFGKLQVSYASLVGPAPIAPEKSKEAEKAQDATNKARDLEIQLMQAQGREYKALTLTREDQLAQLRKDVAENPALGAKSININSGPLVKLVEDLERSYGAFDERGITPFIQSVNDATSSLERAQIAIYNAEDTTKIFEASVDALNAVGHSYETLQLTRERELIALGKGDETLTGTAKSFSTLMQNITLFKYAAEDAAKTQEILNALYTIRGEDDKVTEYEQTRALLGLNDTNEVWVDGIKYSDRTLQKHIWTLEKENATLEKRNALESRIYSLLGKADKIKEIERARERKEAGLTNKLAQAQLDYIYALEDEAELKTKTIDAIKNSINGMKSFIKTLKDMKSSMLLGGDSTLTPMQKYLESKKQIDKLKDLINGPANTSAEIAARDDAMGKLPSALQEMLGFSKTVNASSEQYAIDFASVGTTLDELIASTSDSISVADRQLTALDHIDEETVNISANMAKLVDYADKTEKARLSAAAAGSEAATAKISGLAAGKYVDEAYKTILNRTADTEGRDFWTSAITSGTVSPDQMTSAIKSSTEGTIQGIYQSSLGRYADTGGLDFWSKQYTSGMSAADISGAMKSSPEAIIQGLYKSELGRAADQGGLDFWISKLNSGVSVDSIRSALDSSEEYKKLKGFAGGGFHSGGLRVVGEREPELEATGPSRIWNSTQLSNVLNSKELIDEIKALRQEVAQLRQEQQEQTGHLIQTNYDANMKAAGKVAEATDEAANQTVWAQRNQVKLA